MNVYRLFATVAAMSAALMCSSCMSVDQSGGWLELADDEVPAPMLTNGQPVTVRGVAADIDQLEKHIDRFGSIVPKHADVWGQSRLMMHRQEFERVMRTDIYTFTPTIQALISTSDQAYLANAFTLDAALGKGTPPSGAASLSDVTGLVSKPEDVIKREMVDQSKIAGLVTPNGKLAVEPTIIEDQKKRYLDHLHELRRINEGDDNTDAPGYGLNLVRIPISIITGEKTQTGFGAECTVTATPHLPDDLLPETFKNLVVNDLTGVMTVPLTKAIEDTLITDPDLSKLRGQLAEYELLQLPKPSPQDLKQGTSYAKYYSDLLSIAPASKATNWLDAEKRLKEDIYAKFANAAGLPVSPRRVDQTPLPTSQLIWTFGAHNAAYLALQIGQQIKIHLACKNMPYHLDVQAALKNELSGAYQLLASPEGQVLWPYCNPGLVEAIRTQNVKDVIKIEGHFFDEIQAISKSTFTDPGIPVRRSLTSILAWAIVIDSALLNQRFVEDMKSTHAAKGCPVVPENCWPQLYLPQPPPESCQLFNDYVRCRWPIYVFSIDPETEDQNVGDSFQMRRELQLAMSLAFTSGQMSARNFTRYVRRIEQDIDTIAINRTIVGFSHGDNTFGWRFYPRVQTPPIDSNFEAFFRDLLYGGYGPGYYLRRRRLEDGIRECSALVIMPSFVPYVDLEITGNWFRLADPKHKALNLKQVMRLSQRVQALHQYGGHLSDQECYRPGDVAMMMAKLEQLSQRLPLQQQMVNVPYENTHGGFELLSKGVTDLAPELIGWYGAPGINPNGDTALFLVGDNFSVHQTRVVVGGLMLDPECQIQCSDKGNHMPMDCKCLPPAPSASSAGKSATPPASDSSDDGEQSASAAQSGAEQEVVQAGLLGRLRAQAHSASTAAPAVTVLNNLPLPLPALPVVGKLAAADAKAAAADAKATAAEAKTTAADAKSTAASAKTSSPSKDSSTKADTASAKADSASAKADAASAKADVASAKADAATPPTPWTYDLPHYQMELLSRQVMRIVIPKGAYSNDGKVDIHIATPYGVSQHLQVPVLCDTSAPAAPAFGYSVDDKANSVTVPYKLQRVGATNQYNVILADPPGLGKSAIKIPWTEPTGSALNKVRVLLAFNIDQNATASFAVDLTASDGSFVIDGKTLLDLVTQFLKALEDRNYYSPDRLLPASLSTASIKITPVKDATHAVEDVTLNQSITFAFKNVLAAPEKLPPPIKK